MEIVGKFVLWIALTVLYYMICKLMVACVGLDISTSFQVVDWVMVGIAVLAWMGSTVVLVIV